MFADYLAHGWALCKIKPREKGAFENGWSSREGAYIGPGALDGWKGGAGLLHAYSGTCAIDIDNFKVAAEALATQGIDLAGLLRAPDAVVFGSGRVGRFKLLYALPEPIVGCARNQHGFDFRCMSQQGTSQQDVLAPSIHESGEPYRWLKGDWRDLPPLPKELRSIWPKLKALFPEATPGPKASTAAPGGSSLTAAAMVGSADSAFEGSRNEWLSGQLFGHLRRGGNYEESLDWLRKLNAEKCTPPEDDDKVLKIWRNKANVEPEPIVIAPPPGSLPGTEPLVIVTKPELPFGYEWDGTWIYRSAAGALPKTLIMDGPLYVSRILRTCSPNGTEVRTMEIVTGTGVKMIASTAVLKATDDTLVNYGIYAVNEQGKQVRAYLVKCMKQCEEKGMIVDTYDTFGWQKDSSFLLGTRLYCAGKSPTIVALAPGLKQLADGMAPAPHGSLSAWRESAQDLFRADNMPQAFGLLMGMAAPLMKLSGEKGGIYSLVGESGQGKSTVQNAIGTVFGDPEVMRTVPRDTNTARMIKLSLLSNLPMIAEEMTKMESGDLNTLAYAVSEGRDKDRADQHGDLKLRPAIWNTMLVSSSNTSLLDTLLIADGAPAAYRLLEDHIALPKGAKQSDGDRIMRGLVANQGHAGHVFVQYIVDHSDHLSAMIQRTAGQLATKVQASTKERIRINMLACAIVAGAALNATGVLRFSVAAFVDYGLQVLRKNMGSQEESTVSFADVLQGFVDKNQAGVLRMNKGMAMNVTSIQGRTAPLIMRYDIDTEELMINQAALHTYVQERKQSWLEFTKWLAAQGYEKRRSKNMLSRGSGLPASPQVNVIVLDNARMGAIDATEPRTALTTAAMGV